MCDFLNYEGSEKLIFCKSQKDSHLLVKIRTENDAFDQSDENDNLRKRRPSGEDIDLRKDFGLRRTTGLTK